MLYTALLWASRDALLTGTATPLSRAITFLFDDYDASERRRHSNSGKRRTPTILCDCIDARGHSGIWHVLVGATRDVHQAYSHRFCSFDRRGVRAGSCFGCASRQRDYACFDSLHQAAQEVRLHDGTPIFSALLSRNTWLDPSVLRCLRAGPKTAGSGQWSCWALFWCMCACC